MPPGIAHAGVVSVQSYSRARPSVWINGPRWDVSWLVGTALVVPVGLAVIAMGAPGDAVNLWVTVLVGGPHLFATFLATYMDPKFRRAHGRALVAVTLLVPAFVVAMTFWDFQVLMSFFLFAASLHVLQQNAYLSDVYRRRAGLPEPAWSRWVDYGLLFASFYPCAAYKLVRDDFRLGEVPILIPSIVRSDFTWQATLVAFAALLLLWVAKSAAEHRRGVLNGPKTLLIAVNTVVAFCVPAAASGERLELAFQTVNAWHSVQYLAIVWIALQMRRDSGLQESAFVARITAPGRRAVPFFAVLGAATLALMAAVALMIRLDPFGLTRNEYHYMGVLSPLFVHYALDTYLFFAATRGDRRPDEIALAAPAVA
jgi:hypothetical protein